MGADRDDLVINFKMIRKSILATLNVYRPVLYRAGPIVSTVRVQNEVCMLQLQKFHFAKKGESNKEKKEKEKAKVVEEFSGKELDDIKKDYATSLVGCMDLLEDALAAIKSGRASPTIFDEIEVKAYGENQLFSDLATTVVQGNNNLLVKVFDETVKDEVLKSLQRSEFDLSVQTEGKDIRVKLGTSRKEHMLAAAKKVKESNEHFKRDVRDARHEAL